jgi:ABC-2 type transport system ATP-binding protein
MIPRSDDIREIPPAPTPSGVAVEVLDLTRRFGDKVALDRVTLQVAHGEIHALLGPNGAGKTTLVRILAGLTEPSAGGVRLMGHDVFAGGYGARRLIGLVPSGDRTFYYRISGFENLIFFARLYGLSHKVATARARVALEQVDLTAAMHLPVGRYSHGMQSRLSVARALLVDAPVLLVDEASHDLDPASARRIQDLFRDAARRGAGVIWTTQRVDEIRGFADRVSLLSRGVVRFAGTTAQLMSHSEARRFLLRIRNGGAEGGDSRESMGRVIGGMGTIASDQSGDASHFVLTLADGVVLGDALAALTAARFEILACREERPEIEEAFLRLTAEDPS